MIYTLSKNLVLLFISLLFKKKIIFTDPAALDSGNYLYMSNHITLFDPFFVGAQIKKKIFFMGKKELFRNPLFAWYFRQIHAFPVDRKGFSRSALETALELLKKGESVLLFPEGTRSKTEDFGQPKPGPGMLVARSGAGVIPVYVRLDKKIRLRPRANGLLIVYGKPLHFKTESGENNDIEKKDYYNNIITGVMNEIRSLKEKYSG